MAFAGDRWSNRFCMVVAGAESRGHFYGYSSFSSRLGSMSQSLRANYWSGEVDCESAPFSCPLDFFVAGFSVLVADASSEYAFCVRIVCSGFLDRRMRWRYSAFFHSVWFWA